MAKIKRIGVIKMASFMGLYGAFVGLIVGLIIAIMGTIISTVISSAGFGGVFNLGSMWLAVILFPLGAGISGFISGLIFTPIINLIGPKIDAFIGLVAVISALFIIYERYFKRR